MKISDQELQQALSLFRDSVNELRPTGVVKPVRSFAWRIVIIAFAMLALLIAVPLYRHRQQLQTAEQDDAFLRDIESDVSLSVPPPMQRLEVLMASDSTTNSERVK